jgi:hypothetical protein
VRVNGCIADAERDVFLKELLLGASHSTDFVVEATSESIFC